MSYKTPQEALTEQIRMMDMRYKMLAGKVEMAIGFCREMAEHDDNFAIVIAMLEGKQS